MIQPRDSKGRFLKTVSQNLLKVRLYKETAQGKIDLGICSLQQAKQIAKEDGGTYIFSSIN